MSVSPAAIAQLLQCPVCLEQMTAPILQCEAAHAICAQCQSDLPAPGRCPQCRGAFASPPTRNRTLEALVDALGNAPPPPTATAVATTASALESLTIAPGSTGADATATGESDAVAVARSTPVVTLSAGLHLNNLHVRAAAGGDTGDASAIATDTGEHGAGGASDTAASRPPVDIACVLDVSGSMASAVEVRKSDGTAEDNGLSMLDMVKHATRTVAGALQPGDRLSIITFSSSAARPFALAHVTDAARPLLDTVLQRMVPGGVTNLWAGLELGLTTLHDAKQPGRAQHVVLLTDGQPYPEPPRGTREMVRRLVDRKRGELAAVHCFGFGYKLDSGLLSDVASQTGGMYGFIPDAGFVGTAFIHLASNILATSVQRARLTVELPEGVVVDEARLPADATDDIITSSWGAQVRLGALQPGQSRDVLLPLRVVDAGDSGNGSGDELLRRFGAADAAEQCGVTMHYEPITASASIDGDAGAAAALTATADVTIFDGAEPAPQALLEQVARAELISALADVLHSAELPTLEDKQARVSRCADTLKRLQRQCPNSALVGAYLEDAQGQMEQAVRRADWHTRWGQHYLPSLLCAHRFQVCNNFKDAGVQRYGGAVFDALRDVSDSIFNSLPAPTPSRAAPSFGIRASSCGTQAGAAVPAAPVSMALYNCRTNGCFRGDGAVLLADGDGDGDGDGVRRTKRVDAIKRGDRVRTASGGIARVACVWVTLTPSGLEMSRVRGAAGQPDLCLTPWHPVNIAPRVKGGAGGAWSFPAELDCAATGFDGSCRAIYSFLLESVGDNGGGSSAAAPQFASSCVINGVGCVTLAHGIVDDAIATHAFYGTPAVARALAELPGFETGRVVMREGGVIRDDQGCACALDAACVVTASWGQHEPPNAGLHVDARL